MTASSNKGPDKSPPRRAQKKAKRSRKRRNGRAIRTPRWFRRFGDAVATTSDRLAANDRRRMLAAVAGALLVNGVLFLFMAVFARVTIFIPYAPTDTLNVTLVELDQPAVPDLRDPEIDVTPEEEPEPEPEPEIVEELELEPEPEPVPEPETESAPEPEAEIEPEPEPEPEPVLDLDLTREPQFAPPAEDPEPLILDAPQTAADDLTRPSDETEPEQTPNEETPEPLIVEEPDRRQAAGLDEILGEEEGEGETPAEELAPEEDGETPEAPLQNDDMFDEEPVWGGRRFVRPKVELPLGETPINPGSSGVVAIFCPDEFDDREKIAECAGRPEIRSGWRPGDSGEDWSQAARVLKENQTAGRAGPDLDKVIGPRAARRIEDQERARDLYEPTRGVQDLSDPVGSIGADVGIGSGAGPEPSWTLREDGLLTEDEIEDLREELEAAAER